MCIPLLEPDPVRSRTSKISKLEQDRSRGRLSVRFSNCV